MAVLTILMGLAFPAFTSVQNAVRKTQAKNDLVQIVTAVNAFYTEYGKYPLPANSSADEYIYGATNSSKGLFDSLRGLDAASNPRQIEFIKPLDVKDSAAPRGGIAPPTNGQFYDPWGKPYLIGIDADYDNQVPNPYSGNAGAAPKLRAGVIAWAYGNDQDTTANSDKNAGKNKDDVISWQ